MQNKMRKMVLDMIKQGKLDGTDKREAQYIAFIMTTSQLCYNLVHMIDDKEALLELYEFVEFIEYTIKEDFGYEHKMS